MIIDMRGMIAVLATAALTAACEPPAPGGEAAAPADTAALGAARDERGVVLFVGTSLTAGYGVGEAAAFPAVIEDSIDAAGLPYRVVNAGISGETSAGGLRRIDWSLQEPVEVLVLELGANDGLRGLPVDELRGNLEEIIRRTRARYPDAAVVIAGMEAPPNLGEAYTTRFRRVFAELAEQHDAALIPFLLEGVAGVASLNQDDRIHPTAAGHEAIAATVWAVLEPLLRSRGVAVYIDQRCGLCHALPNVGAAGTFGPTHEGMRATAERRVADADYAGTATTAWDYIRESILRPEAYRVPGYEQTLFAMPAYTNLSDPEVEALVRLLHRQVTPARSAR